MGLIKSLSEAETRQHTPKVAFVAKPQAHPVSSGKQLAETDVDLLVRALSMGKLHHAMMGTAAVAIGTAAAIPGTWLTWRPAAVSAVRYASATHLHLESRRRSRIQGRPVAGDQGHHESLGAHPDGRRSTDSGRQFLTVAWFSMAVVDNTAVDCLSPFQKAPLPPFRRGLFSFLLSTGQQSRIKCDKVCQTEKRNLL